MISLKHTHHAPTQIFLWHQNIFQNLSCFLAAFCSCIVKCCPKKIYIMICVCLNSKSATLARTRACTGVWARWSTATAATARPGGRRSTRRSSSGPGTTRPDTGKEYYIFENYRESLLTSLTPGGTGSTAAATPATSTGTAATAATGRATGTPTPRPPRTRLSCTPTQRTSRHGTRREFRRVDTSVL